MGSTTAAVDPGGPQGRLLVGPVDAPGRGLPHAGVRPARQGRLFFDALVTDNLDVGRPNQIELIFGRRVLPSTTGVFATRVVTRGVDVTVNAFYRHSRVKQYFKLRHEVARCEWTRRQEGRLMSVA